VDLLHSDKCVESGRTGIDHPHDIMIRARTSDARAPESRRFARVDELLRIHMSQLPQGAAFCTITPIAAKGVRALESEGVLRDVTGHSWGRLSLADPILRIIDPRQPERSPRPDGRCWPGHRTSRTTVSSIS
jgi:hypothetical protein